MNASGGAIFDIKPTRNTSRNDKKCDKEHIKNLDYTNVTSFPVTQKDYRKIEIMNNINISVFGYENKNHIQFTYQKRNSTIS